MQIVGTFSTGEALSIAIRDVKFGAFDIATSAAAVDYTLSSAAVDSYVGSAGNVTISSFTSSTVTGSFQFTGLNPATTSMAITAGTFQANHK